MPPSFSTSVGVPLTVTASLSATVSSTTSPALRMPVPARMPVPEVVIDETTGAVVSCGGATKGVPPASAMPGPTTTLPMPAIASTPVPCRLASTVGSSPAP